MVKVTPDRPQINTHQDAERALTTGAGGRLRAIRQGQGSAAPTDSLNPRIAHLKAERPKTPPQGQEKKPTVKEKIGTSKLKPE